MKSNRLGEQSSSNASRFSQPVNNSNENGDENRQGSATGSQRLKPNEVSMDEYNELSKRLDTMESSVGFVLTKVRFLDANRPKRKRFRCVDRQRRGQVGHVRQTEIGQ